MRRTPYTAYVAEAAGLTYAAATEGRDYRHTTGTLTFGPGRLRHTITVPIINDGAQEEPELFQIWMQRVKETDRRIRGPGRAARVVIDRSDYPLVSLWDAEGVEGEDMVFTVALSKATGADVTVDWTVDFWRGSTADAADFETMRGTATVAAGSREATFTVATADDAADEEDETFLVRLSNFSWNSQIGDPTATGVITDNDVSPFEPSVVRNVTVLSGPGPDAVWSAGERVELEVRYSLPVVVRQPRYWVDADGARHPPGPFVTVAFRSGARPGYGQSLGVALVPYVRGSGTDRLRFAYRVGADEAGARRVVVAHDAMVLRGATIRTLEGGDGSSRYTNTRVMQTTVRKPDGAAWTGGDTVRVAVRFAGPVSYTPPDEPLNRDKVVVDETGGTPSIRLLVGDRERRPLRRTASYEGGSGSNTLTFEYEVTAGDGRVSAVEVVADSLARNGATIRNEEGYDAELEHVSVLWYSPLALLVREAAAREGGTLEFALELARASRAPVTVDYETADGTAAAGRDYTAKRGTVTFAPGRTRKTVEVRVLRDGEAEDAETVVLRLSNARSAGSKAPVEVTVAQAEGTIEDVAPEAPSGGLTARFARAPAEHDGSSPFKVRVAFSEAVRMSGRRLRADVVAVAGGRTTKARPVNGRKDLWELTVKPGSNGDVVLTLAGGAACDSPGAVCTPDGRALANTISTVVRGPVAVSVADARAEEGEDETIDFRVSLSRAASRTVTVTYATADRTARAGEDYTRTSGKLGFAPGETERTVRVPVLDDAVDEGEETLTLRLTNASGARIADGEATGTIVNSDPLQKTWLSRFGRTVAGQVVEAVSERLARPLTGAQVTLAGRSVDLARANGEAELANAAAGLARALGAGDAPEPEEGAGGWAQPQPRTRDYRASAGASTRSVSGRELLLGSTFHLATQRGAGAPSYAVWGRVTTGGFDGEDVSGAVTTRADGDVTTGILGADAAWERWLAGVALSVSEGEGTFGQSGGLDDGNRGTVESSLTSVQPYVRLEMSERLSAWGLLGFGSGDMTMTQAATQQRAETVTRTDLSMRLGAAGARGVLLEADESGGIDLALRGDAFLVQMDWEKVSNETDTRADASRLRVVLEGGRPFALGEGAVLTPALELGLRHDGGDAETGTGVEVGGRIRFADAGSGLTVEANARILVAHEDSEYEEWGVSGSVRLDPGASGRGLSLSLAPVWGTPSSGVDRLWSARDAAGLAPGGEFEAERRLEAELGYGFGLSGTRGLLTPYTALSWAEGGARTRTGARWQLAPAAALGLEWTHEPGAGEKPSANALMLRTQVRW